MSLLTTFQVYCDSVLLVEKTISPEESHKLYHIKFYMCYLYMEIDLKGRRGAFPLTSHPTKGDFGMDYP